MRLLGADPKLVELVQDAILADVAAGKLAAGDIVQPETCAKGLGVSRQPVQQALQVLQQLGVLCEVAGGLRVAPLDTELVRNLYDVRALMEGLAFRKAAERNAARAAAEGPALLRAGRQAVEGGSVADMIEADMAFHEFIYGLSANPFVAPAIDRHWTQTQRAMGESLMRGAAPTEIWRQHAEMLEAVIAGDGPRAELLAREHVERAAARIIARLGNGRP
jgi:DNA-binding GntR family transcriptional regulator